MGNQAVKISSRGEVCWAVIGIVCCVGVAAALAPKDNYFLPNALFYLFSQLGVVILALIGLPRPAAVGGVAVAVSLYLMAFWTWVQASGDLEGLVWFGYLFSLPGAVLGAVAIVMWLKANPQVTPFVAFCISAAAVVFGVSMNQAVVCKTVLYCSIPWK